LSAPEDRSILTLTGALAGLTGAEVLAASEVVSHVHFASYFLVPTLARELPAVLTALRERGVTVSLDTTWDPAERWDGVQQCLGLVDLLMPNSAEAIALAAAVGTDTTDIEAAALALASYGPT